MGSVSLRENFQQKVPCQVKEWFEKKHPPWLAEVVNSLAAKRVWVSPFPPFDLCFCCWNCSLGSWAKAAVLQFHKRGKWWSMCGKCIEMSKVKPKNHHPCLFNWGWESRLVIADTCKRVNAPAIVYAIDFCTFHSHFRLWCIDNVPQTQEPVLKQSHIRLSLASTMCTRGRNVIRFPPPHPTHPNPTSLNLRSEKGYEKRWKTVYANNCKKNRKRPYTHPEICVYTRMKMATSARKNAAPNKSMTLSRKNWGLVFEHLNEKFKKNIVMPIVCYRFTHFQMSGIPVGSKCKCMQTYSCAEVVQGRRTF